MATREVEEQSYWPGYVDAIINVVLNILFIVALFTLALSTVEFSPPKVVQSTPDTTPAPQGAQPEKAVEELAQQVPLQIAISARAYKSQLSNPTEANDLAGSAATKLVTWDTRKLEEGAQLVTVTFDEKVAEIPPPQGRAFSTALRDLGREAPKGQWLIWLSSDTRQASASRLAYLRVLSVRSVLVEAGVSPEFIQTRIIDIRDSSDTPVNRVQLALYAS
jgi:hypothetical protein